MLTMASRLAEDDIFLGELTKDFDGLNIDVLILCLEN